MNYLTLENISHSFTEKVLFENISISINEGEKVALVAKNGSGKTTLLKIAAGTEIPEAGRVYLRKEIRTGVLEQEPVFDLSKTVLDEVFDSSVPVLDAIKNYEHYVLHPHEKENLDAALAQMDLLKAWDHESKVKQILSRLSISNLEQEVKTLSGGQRKRVALAKVLIHDPDFLILDEPTNHLDLEMIEWLEQYLSKSGRTLLLITHDRIFLENICDTILELDNGIMYRYKGNYSYYLEQKASRLEVSQSQVSKAQNLMRKELDWMRRQPKARTTKSKSRIDSFYELNKQASVKLDEEELQLEINMPRLGGKVLEFHHVHKVFGDLKVLNNFSYKFRNGERIGIIGRNGAGKSTLLNLMIGLDRPDAGKIVTGETVQFGYFSQEGIQLNEDKRVIEVVKEIADFIPLAKGKTLSASQLLERFLFPQDQHYTYVSKLSGGERRRLHLLTVLIKNPNFLILDEPTNDLDIITLQVLEDFLLDFPGVLVLVSHDRHFLNKLVSHLLVFEEEGRVTAFAGNYMAWIDSRQKNANRKKEDESVVVAEKKNSARFKTRLSYHEKIEFERLEKEMEELEERKVQLSNQMNSGTLKFELLQQHGLEYNKVLSLLEEKTDRWLVLSEMKG